MTIADTVRTVLSRASEENVTFFASSIAYYAFFSIVPLILLTLSIGSLAGGEAFAERIVGAVEGHLSESGQDLVGSAVENQSGQVGASLVGFVGLGWSAIKVIRAVDMAFDEIYGSDVETSLTGQIRDGIVVLVLVGVGVAVMVGAGTVIGRPDVVDVPYVGLVGWLVLVVGLIVVFLPLYYVMPPTRMTVSRALPGTIVAAVGWLVLQAGFQVYSTYAADFEAYGVIGGVLLFLTYLYFAGILVLLGAVVNASFEQDLGVTTPEPTRGAPDDG